jgi:hypothetical protein
MNRDAVGSEHGGPLSARTRELRTVLWDWYNSESGRLIEIRSTVHARVKSRWIHRNDDFFERVPAFEYSWSVQALAEASSSATWAPVQNVLDSRAETRGQVGSFIRMLNVGRAFRPIDVADRLLTPPVAWVGPKGEVEFGEPDREDFERKVEGFIAFLHSDIFSIATTMLINGVENVNESRLLDESLYLVTLTTDDIAEALELGVIPLLPPGLSDSHLANFGPQTALRRFTSIRKEFVAEGSGFAAPPVYSPVDDLAPFLQTLALVAPGAYSSTGYFTKALSAFSIYPTQFVPTRNDMATSLNPLFISEALWGNVRQTFSTIQGERFKRLKSASLVVRRFHQSTIRTNIDDRLLDLMIAAEGLFLQDSNSELSFKLSIRAAKYLSQDVAVSERLLLDFFQCAYDLRSKIVHGSSPHESFNVLGETLTLGALVTNLENFLRVAINKRLALDSPNALDKNFWSAFITR